jgi:hypothetical protein
MTQAPYGLGAALGALIAVTLAAIALAFFLFTGGDKKTVHGDKDLPPIAQGQR